MIDLVRVDLSDCLSVGVRRVMGKDMNGYFTSGVIRGVFWDNTIAHSNPGIMG